MCQNGIKLTSMASKTCATHDDKVHRPKSYQTMTVIPINYAHSGNGIVL